MKETIYTIPVMEALETLDICPFCAMHAALEHNAINFLMGPSVAYMEDDVRMATNSAGFCRAHYQKLYETKNRLGLALMLHTHFMEVNKTLVGLYEAQARQKPALFSKGEAPLADKLKKISASCYVCDMIEKSYTRYIDTFFQLFAKEEAPRERLRQNKGFCLPHLAQVAELAPKRLKAPDAQLLYQIIFDIQKRQMAKIEADLDWFVKKFDYRNQNEPWGDARDACERAIQRLVSAKPAAAVKGGC